VRDTELYARAIVQWGAESQLLMACEEAGELAVVIHHYLRGRAHQSLIAEEVADMEFMLEQVKALFGADFSDLVHEWRITKRMRLESMLAEESKLPTIDEYIGSDPDFTGGATTKEYVDDMRGTKPEEARQ
jgi:NTP pyrophosphatase (non-canonical NTP hydrolase)